MITMRMAVMAGAIGAFMAGAPAAAQMLMIDQPMTTAHLRNRGVDMTVMFRREPNDRFKVEAAFVAPFDGKTLGAVSLELGSGESVSYAPPGQQQLTYRFARDASVLIVTVHRASKLKLGGVSGG